MNENRNLPEELDENELEQVAGGADNDAYLDEDRIPGGWTVSCFDCGARFPAAHGECPRCGSKHVRMTY